MTAQQQTAVAIATAFGFRKETRTDAEILRAYNADKAKSEAKRRYDEALRLDIIAERERCAREAAGKTVVSTTTTRALSDAEREESRRRAEAEAEAARQLVADGRINVVKVAPERKPIPADVLAAGLAADIAACAKQATKKVAEDPEAERVRRLAETLQEDIAREAERVAKEAKFAPISPEVLSAGYSEDVRRAAGAVAFNDKMSLPEKVAAFVQMGFVYEMDGKNGVDARYFHEKAKVFFWLKGAATGEGPVARPKKARGSELLSAEEMEKRRLINEEANAKAKLARRSTKPAASPKKDKKSKDDDKKSKRK